MQFKSVWFVIPIWLWANSIGAAETISVDSLTKLPVPLSGEIFSLYDAPMRLDAFSICKSTANMNFYTPKIGKVEAAVAWYAVHLKGFKHTSGYGSGRSQDTFYNATGTLIVSITGSPAKQGENSDAYSVTYGTLQPGESERVIVGINAHNIDCR